MKLGVFRFAVAISASSGLIGLFPLGTLAQSDPPCSIDRVVSGTLYPNSSLATQLQSYAGESFFEVRCKVGKVGRLRLLIEATNAHGATAQFRVTSTNGIFTAANSSDYVTNAMIGFRSSAEQLIGRVSYQVQVTASNGRLLQAARDYSVRVQAVVDVDPPA